MRIEENYSLRKHNTFGIDAKCRRFLEYASEDEAVQVAALLRSEASPYMIIGGGSNLLLTRDFEGTVVHSAIKGICFHGNTAICGSGEVWDDVVSAMLDHQLYGAENLSAIPGDVGASAVQNIGAYGAEVKDLIERVVAIDIQTGLRCEFLREECGYGYRQSHFKSEWKNRYLITEVHYCLSPRFEPCLDYGNVRSELARKGISEPTAYELRETIIGIRKDRLPDPQTEGNAGSFFVNPVVSRTCYEALAARYEGMPHYCVDDEHEKIPAGWMIDQCGWKGKSFGRAGVHDKQALVLVNRGGASGAEIVALCRQIQQDVMAKFGIEIQPEVNIV